MAARACLHGTSPDQTAPAPSGPGRRLIVRRREEHRGTGAPGHARGTDVRAGHVRRPRHRPGRPPGHARRGDPAGGGRGGAGRRARPGLLRRRRAPPRRLRGLGARRGARGDRRRRPAHPARHQRDGAQLRRPDPGVPAVLHPRRASRSGRAEVTLGRGSFTESFPLFGLRWSDYEVLFSEKLDLFAELLRGGAGDLGGHHPPAAREPARLPATAAGRLPAWVGVGGTPQSVVRAARYGLPLVLAVIGGSPAGSCRSPTSTARRSAEFGHEPLPIGMHSPGHVAATDELAREQIYPHQAELVHPHRPRARLARRTRGIAFDAGGRPRGRAVRRLARDGRAQDRLGGEDAGPVPLPAEVLRRHPAARPAAGVGPAVRRGGGARGCGSCSPTRRAEPQPPGSRRCRS